MTRPFDPRDFARVRGLQRTGCSLDLEGDVLVGSSPLSRAVAGLIPWGAGRVVTLVESRAGEPKDRLPARCGLVQHRPRRSGKSTDLLFVSPSLDLGSGSHLLWQRLLTDASRSAGACGVERLLAAVPEEDTSAQQVLRQVGFAQVGSDVVMRRPAGPIRGAPSSRHVVDAGLDLKEEVRLLAGAASTGPRANPGAWTDYPLGGWLTSSGELRTMVAPHGAVEAAWRVIPGKHGTWLQLLAFPSADPATAVALAMAECKSARDAGPVYCAEPESAAPLITALHGAGFETLVRRVHLAKLTAAHVIEPAWDLRRSPERALDPAKAGPP